MSLRSEIFEQPFVIARMLEERKDAIQDIGDELRSRDVDLVFLAGRGTSDNAGLYAKYVLGTFNRLPVAMAAPSMFSLYERPPVLRNALVVGISQSGQSPDIVSVVAEGRNQSTSTLAITNDPESPLAETAEFIIDIGAGEEKAVAATKTYTSELLAIAILSVALADDERRAAALHRLPEMLQQALGLETTIERVAQRYRYMEQCVVLGRGYNYATAYEWSLKLKELAYVVAEPYSSADFQHGPVAIASQGFPVLAVVPDGVVFDDVLGLLSSLVSDHQVELLVISNREEALDLAHTPLRLPEECDEWLTPIVSIVLAQLFCYHLTRAKGYNTEAPRGLSKVTLTW